MVLSVRTAAIALVALGAWWSVVAAVARASFPGANGKLAVTLEGCGDLNLYIDAFDVSGHALGPLTPPCEPSTVGDPELEEKRSTHGPEWFPDGTRLLHVDDDKQLMSVAADGADPQPFLARQVVNSRTRVPITLPNGAAIAPDGKHVVFDTGDAILRADAAATTLDVLISAPSCAGSSFCFEFGSPRWSPDGRTIAFESHPITYGAGRKPRLAEGIWLMNARSGKLLRRVARRGFDVDWSPDSTHLVYRTTYVHEIARGATGGNLYVVRRDGSHRRLLVHRERLAEIVPKWSPDGRWIAWISLRVGKGELSFTVRPSLWRVRASGGRPKLITKLRRPTVEEGEFLEPELAWQPLPPAVSAH